eukprot:TRINITY_DN13867_c0_g1_i3.p1 TRINITY_DN13867_c0_g1~~TRINITY_DN13867_c0_g1_i3.p1  ORF type:complete len:354 (-),score=62.85 TRINITY_DN13867_c0_g1_i3:27-1088(-)
MQRLQQIVGSTIPSQHLHIEDVSEITVGITLINKERLNAAHPETEIFLSKLFRQLEANGKRFLLLKGVDEKSFCSGGDLHHCLSSVKKGEEGINQALRGFYFQFDFVGQIAELKLTQISIWTGIVMGFGVFFSVYGKFRIATETTLFGVPECKIGFYPDNTATYYLPKIPKNVGLYLGLTGDPLIGEEVYHAGIANYILKNNQIPEFVDGLRKVRTDEEVHDLLVRLGAKPQVKELPKLKIIESMFVPTRTIFELIDRLEQNKQIPFVKSALDRIRVNNPLSVYLTFELYKRGPEPTLRDSIKFNQEFVDRFFKICEFEEGVTSLLFTKKKPNWKYKLEELTLEFVNSLITGK